MSAGHRWKGNAQDAPDNRFLDDREWVQLCQECPLILTWLSKPRRISYDYHIPYLGGISKDGSVVYIDSRFDPKLSLMLEGAHAYMDSGETIPDHEVAEYVLERFYGFQYESTNPLRSAHVAGGNTAERLAVRALGFDWDEYNAAIDRQLQGIELEQVVHCPPDLALFPYQEDPELLAKIKACQ